jgi:NADH-quinone oxidoreductase subunit I
MSAFPKKPPTPTNARVVTPASRSAAVQAYVPEAVHGVAISMKHFFRNTKEMLRGERPDPVTESLDPGISTISYPEQKRPYPARTRGVHRLTVRADGKSPRCVACYCCSTACPAQCIYIEAGEYPEGDDRRGYEKYPVKFVIDELRCVFCGFCVEACPCDAIRMDTGVHAPPYDTRDQFLYSEGLLTAFASADGQRLSENPRHEPGDPTYPGLTRDQKSH